MKISIKNKRVLIFITVLTMLLLLFLNTFLHIYTAIHNTKTQSNLIINQIEDVLTANEKDLANLMESIKEEYIILAKAASYIIEHNPSYEHDLNELKKIAQLLQVDEIHLFDTTGTIYSGTIPEYYNYNFDSGEQIGFFKPMLTDQNLSLCQDLTPNTAAAKPMMYALVWREDKAGMVQIGQEPVRLLEEQEKNQLSYLFSNMPSQPGDTMCVIDNTTMSILGSTNESYTGMTLTELGMVLPKKSLMLNGFFTNVEGVSSYCVFHEYQDYYIAIIRNTSAVFDPILLPMFLVFLSLVFASVVIIVAIYLNSKKVQEHQRELQTALNKAEIASKSKSNFLFNMSHDIRTPMNAILGFSKVAQLHIDDKAKVLRSLKNLDSAGEQLEHLINDVLDMARIENNDIELDFQAHHIPTTMSTVESLFAAETQKKNITLTVGWNITDEIAFYDKFHMEQVELNLISNAIKYTPEGGTITYNFNQVGPAQNGVAIYEGIIKDNGIGISKEFQPYLFDAFAREKNSTTSGIQGTGLGLPLTKSILEKMGGCISCTSEPGKGSEFTFRVPFKIGNESDLPEEPDTAETAANQSFLGKRLLLAEDIEINREIIIELLADYGLLIDVAEDGLIAVEKVSKASPGYYSLILMDIQMPNMNGYQATETIRHFNDPIKSQIPIIAITANAFEEDRKNALIAGMNDHLAKPIEVQKLIEALEKYLKNDIQGQAD